MSYSQVVLPMLIGLTLLVSSGSGTADEPSSQSVLLVANKAEHTLGIVDPEAGKQIITIAENGITGHEVVASPDGRTAFVPIYGNSGVGKPGTDGRNMIVVDIASRKITGNVDFGHGARPHCAVFWPKGRAAQRYDRDRQGHHRHRSPHVKNCGIDSDGASGVAHARHLSRREARLYIERWSGYGFCHRHGIKKNDSGHSDFTPGPTHRGVG